MFIYLKSTIETPEKGVKYVKVVHKNTKKMSLTDQFRKLDSFSSKEETFADFACFNESLYSQNVCLMKIHENPLKIFPQNLTLNLFSKPRIYPTKSHRITA